MPRNATMSPIDLDRIAMYWWNDGPPGNDQPDIRDLNYEGATLTQGVPFGIRFRVDEDDVVDRQNLSVQVSIRAAGANEFAAIDISAAVVSIVNNRVQYEFDYTPPANMPPGIAVFRVRTDDGRGCPDICVDLEDTEITIAEAPASEPDPTP